MYNLSTKISLYLLPLGLIFLISCSDSQYSQELAQDSEFEISDVELEALAERPLPSAAPEFTPSQVDIITRNIQENRKEYNAKYSSRAVQEWSCSHTSRKQFTEQLLSNVTSIAMSNSRGERARDKVRFQRLTSYGVLNTSTKIDSSIYVFLFEELRGTKWVEIGWYTFDATIYPFIESDNSIAWTLFNTEPRDPRLVSAKVPQQMEFFIRDNACLVTFGNEYFKLGSVYFGYAGDLLYLERNRVERQAYFYPFPEKK